jgi:hypothetical protein
LHPVLRFWLAECRPVAVRLLAYMGAIAGLAMLAAEILHTPEVSAAIQPSSVWLTVEKAHPAFELKLPDSNAEPVYAIHRHVQGGGRKDSITIGDPGRSERAIVIEVYRPGAELSSFPDAASEIVARTSALHRIGPVRPLPPVETKFGPVALFDFLIRPERDKGRCTGFVHTSETPPLQIVGFYCVPQDSLIEASQIACALDRFTLLSAGSDPQIGTLFAHAELKRKFCRQRSPLVAATPKRATRQAPVRLRGQIAGN